MGMKFAWPKTSPLPPPFPCMCTDYTSNNAIAGAVLFSNYALIPDGNIGEGQTNEKKI